MAAAKVGILGQVNPGANSSGDLYTVPAGRRAVISTLVACNQAGGAATKIRAWARINGAAIANGNAIAYDIDIDLNGRIAFTEGICVDDADVISVQAGTANVTWTAFGTEEDNV